MATGFSFISATSSGLFLLLGAGLGSVYTMEDYSVDASKRPEPEVLSPASALNSQLLPVAAVLLAVLLVAGS